MVRRREWASEGRRRREEGSSHVPWGAVLMSESGLSLEVAVLLLSLILVIVDIFVASDFPTHIAYVLLAVLASVQLDAPTLYRVVLGLVAWGALVAFHYLLWRSVLERISNRWIAPTRYADGASGIVGARGQVVAIEGRLRLRASGDLWDFESKGGILQAGDEVVVISEEFGVLQVEKQKGG